VKRSPFVNTKQAMYRRIIHLSHTDIRFDSRILKEMRAAASLEGCSVLGVGFELSEGAATNPDAAECRLLTLKLVSRSWRMIPRALRYCFNCLELTFAILLALRNNRPTVVHCHDTLVLPVGWLAKAIFNCALVYDAHELESNKNGQGPLLSKITLLVERFCWKRVDLFISVSVQIVDWYKERLGDKTAIVILNSPEISAYKASAELTFENRYLRDRFRIPETSSIFVYVGYFGYGRGIDEYINVFEEVGDRAHLVFLGYGELLGHIASRVKSQSNMHIHPAVPHQDVVRVISGADVGLCMVEDVSLSDFLSLPNKLFE